MSTVDLPSTTPVTASNNPPSASPTPAMIPRLEPGDSLSRDEFERRYFAMTDCKKAELIEGVVYMPSPVSYKNHGQPHHHAITWTGVYAANTPGIGAGDNTTVRLDMNNEPQPDVLMFIEPQFGGAVKLVNGYIEGAPDFVVEIAASSVSIDLHAKRQVYLRNGVKEYLVWRVLDRAIDWFVLRSSEYATLTPGADGIHRSENFPGLWLHAEAMLSGDLAKVLQALQTGLQDESHVRFVEQLSTQRK